MDSFVDRAKDTLKVSGAQVSPTEIEQVLLSHPGKLISDACVAGVSGGRTSDELLPRAWVVLNEEGRKKGADAVLKELEKWTNDNLSSYKKLRGGLEVVPEVSDWWSGVISNLFTHFVVFPDSEITNWQGLAPIIAGSS